MISFPHVAMVMSKQHHYVTEMLSMSTKFLDRKEASAARAKTKCLSSPTAPLPQDKHNL